MHTKYTVVSNNNTKMQKQLPIIINYFNFKSNIFERLDDLSQ